MLCQKAFNILWLCCSNRTTVNISVSPTFHGLLNQRSDFIHRSLKIKELHDMGARPSEKSAQRTLSIFRSALHICNACWNAPQKNGKTPPGAIFSPTRVMAGTQTHLRRYWKYHR
jgi:hypothetical protein